MIQKKLPYGPEGLAEIKQILNENRNDSYSLSLYDILTDKVARIECPFEEMLQIICFAIDMEHDYPDWIGIDETSKSYIVGLRFTRGRLETPAVYKTEDGKLKRIHFDNEA